MDFKVIPYYSSRGGTYFSWYFLITSFTFRCKFIALIVPPVNMLLIRNIYSARTTSRNPRGTWSYMAAAKGVFPGQFTYEVAESTIFLLHFDLRTLNIIARLIAVPLRRNCFRALLANLYE